VPSAGLTGAIGTAITTACKNADTAWTTFKTGYGTAATNAKKATVATTASSAFNGVLHYLAQAVASDDATASYLARAQEVEQHANIVSKDLQSLAGDLKAGDASAAAAMYSNSNPLSPVQLDETSFKSACGT
jgi:hypothetical protein